MADNMSKCPLLGLGYLSTLPFCFSETLGMAHGQTGRKAKSQHSFMLIYEITYVYWGEIMLWEDIL